MKKLSRYLVFLLCALLCLCGGNRRQKLYVYNWTYYMPPNVLDDFRKKFNIDLVYDVYPSNEDMFAKLKSGATGYDIVVPSGRFRLHHDPRRHARADRQGAAAEFREYRHGRAPPRDLRPGKPVFGSLHDGGERHCSQQKTGRTLSSTAGRSSTGPT